MFMIMLQLPVMITIDNSDKAYAKNLIILDTFVVEPQIITKMSSDNWNCVVTLNTDLVVTGSAFDY